MSQTHASDRYYPFVEDTGKVQNHLPATIGSVPFPCRLLPALNSKPCHAWLAR
jgi:hypothetical protein